MSRRSPNRNLNLEESSDLRKGFPTRFDENMTILDDHAHVVADLTDPENLPGGASSLVHNVADFDAAGDGVTNDTDGIQAAYDAAETDGGIVFFPPGVFMVDADQVSFPSRVSTVGSGIDATILRRRTGGTGTVLQSKLAGTADNTTYGFTIRDITFDGNYGKDGTEAFGGTGGSGLYIQGDSYTLHNFRIINCKQYGFYGYSTDSISNGPGSASPPIGGQTRITNFALHNCYSSDAAFNWVGPSDSFIDGFVVEMNDVTHPPNHIALRVQSGGMKISNFHLWSDRAALTQLSLESNGNLVTNATIESSAPNGQLVLLLGDSNVLHGCDLYDNTPDHTLHKGIVFGDGSHTVNDNYIRAQIANCYAGALDVTHAGVGNNIDVHVVTPTTTATVLVGTLGANNRLSYSKYDTGGYSKNVVANVLGGVTVTGTPSVGQVLVATSSTAADWEDAPGVGAELGYAEILVDDTTTNTTFDDTNLNANKIPGLSVTVTGTGRPVSIEYFGAQTNNTVSVVTSAVLLTNGTVANGYVAANTSTPTAASTRTGYFKRRLILTNGVSYTFEVGKWVTGGTGTYHGASNGTPIFLTVTQL